MSSSTLLATQVETDDDLRQIEALSRANGLAQLTAEEQAREGFVSWPYHLEILQRLHRLAPSVIVKDGDTVAGYAIVLPTAAAAIYPPLRTMLDGFGAVIVDGAPLFDHRFYVMGQICVAAPYRGRGVFQQLYQHHRALHARDHAFVLTEISTANPRSRRAHAKLGFRSVHTHDDAAGSWDVVIWDWT